MAAYMALLGAAYAASTGVAPPAAQIYFTGHLLAAVIMAAPATIIVAKILRPEKGDPVTMGKVKIAVERQQANVIEAAAAGAGDGLRLALNVAGMLSLRGSIAIYSSNGTPDPPDGVQKARTTSASIAGR